MELHTSLSREGERRASVASPLHLSADDVADRCPDPSTHETDIKSPGPVTGDVEKAAGIPRQQICCNDGNVNNDLVEFEGPNDPGNPKAWPRPKRWGVTISMGMMTFVVTFASSIFSVAIEPVSKEYHCSTVVSTLGVSLFVLVRGLS